MDKFSAPPLVERYCTIIELGYIPFNKLPLVERPQPIVLQFRVSRLGGSSNMAAED